MSSVVFLGGEVGSIFVALKANVKVCCGGNWQTRAPELLYLFFFLNESIENLRPRAIQQRERLTFVCC